MKQIRLGVNIDHVATIRQARGTVYPEPVEAALIAQQSGADGITMHLREDRRHIQDRDLYMVKEVLHIPLNMEMAVTDEMITIAEKVKPTYCCLVPEKREELTTEGGLDVVGQFEKVAAAVARLSLAGIQVSLFIDPNVEQIKAAAKTKAPIVELHTGQYAELPLGRDQLDVLAQIQYAARKACKQGLIVNAGHGLHYHNTQAIAAIPEMHELNIGHSIVARALITGFAEAVSEMKRLICSD